MSGNALAKVTTVSARAVTPTGHGSLEMALMRGKQHRDGSKIDSVSASGQTSIFASSYHRKFPFRWKDHA